MPHTPSKATLRQMNVNFGLCQRITPTANIITPTLKSFYLQLVFQMDAGEGTGAAGAAQKETSQTDLHNVLLNDCNKFSS